VLVICSASLPYVSEDPPSSREFEDFVHYYKEEDVCLVLTYRSNSHNMACGNANCNERRVAELEVLNSSNLEILNQGNDPTDFSARSLEVIVITLGVLRETRKF
jgi:hypothetical protein